MKSLKLVGFKSFADRTTLELRPGVTVVVGPNGSGKSNLVDALSWVMGTQSPKALRTGKMEDVVFAGTATRPALNRAEVTLLIDNGERRLPLDLDEVAITRRLYRDGSSDYEINNVSCRLLDIEELLSDSGVGRHQHVIIGQGEIGMVLNASPDEHRAVIEEAAGILKHRRRKEKAERRLERTGDDLLRLQDLMGEIERQMRPLKRQARAAERYHGLKGEVQALVLYLARHTLERLDSELISLGGEQNDLNAQIAIATDSVASLTAGLENLTALAGSVGASLDTDTASAARLETTVERLRRMGSVAHERLRNVDGRAEAMVERRADLESELEGIEVELGEMVPAAAAAEASADVREKGFRRLEDEERSLGTQTSLSPEGAAAAIRGELSVIQAANTRDLREAESITNRLEVVVAQSDAELAEIDRINEEIKRVDEMQSELSVVYASATRARSRDQGAWSTAEEEVSGARLDHAATLARVDAVKAALQGGLDLEARQSVEGSSGALGTLFSLLEVPKGLERAVEAALGEWVGSVAFSDSAEMAGAVEVVKSTGSGGVPVVARTLGESPSPATEVASGAGVDALIDRLPGRVAIGIKERLLGDVLLVEGWKSGWELVHRHPGLRAVTPEGDLITTTGIRVAHPDGTGPAMLEAAEVALEKADTSLARSTSIVNAAKRDFDKSREAERAALEALEAVEASLAGKTEAMASLQKSADALADEIGRLRERKDSLEGAVGSRTGQVADMQGRLAALEGESAKQVRAWEEMEQKRLAVAASRELARAEWQEAAAHARSILERRRLLEERSERIRAELRQAIAPEAGHTDIESLKVVEATAKRAVDVLVRKLAELRSRQSDLRVENERVLTDLAGARELHDQARTSIAAGRERLGQIEVRLTEVRLHKESLIERVDRDADAGVDEARRAERPQYPEDTDLEQVLEERSAQLRRLGPINPLAADEYRDLNERHTFLFTQLSDVESSRRELKKVIEALETEIDQRFHSAFSEVAEAYQRYFAILFPGGRGKIRLLDPDDPHAGLSIEAQPVGKKVSQMSLLSGGERSLAALAFLFSIFEARPSPFYVLDEVEAALDDANLRRFLRIVDEFRQKAQVVIVTHQQQTMEVADVLYGVTMEPGGSSQAIRKEMTGVTADRVA